MSGGYVMIEQMNRLQKEMESLGEAVDAKLGALRTEMREGFARQEAHVIALRSELVAITTELGRDIARQGASFDQAMAGMQEEYARSRRAQSTIFATLIERSAEMDNDVGDLKRDTKDLRRRLDALEQRLAG